MKRPLLILLSVLYVLLMVPACSLSSGPSAGRLGLPGSGSEVEIQAFHVANRHGQSTQFQFSFSEPVDRVAVESAIALFPEPTMRGNPDRSPRMQDTFFWADTGSTMAYVPGGQLDAGTEYEVALVTGRSGEPALHRAAVLVPDLDTAALARDVRGTPYARAAEGPLAGVGAGLSWKDASAVSSEGETLLVVPAQGAIASVSFSLDGRTVTSALMSVWFSPGYPICHGRSGNDGAQTIYVDRPAVATHLFRHGEQLGPCPGDGGIEYAIVQLGENPSGGRGSYDEHGEPMMTSFGYSSGTETLAELTTFVAPEEAAVQMFADVRPLADDIGGGGGEATCNPDAVEGYESTIELFEGFLAEYEAEASPRRVERGELLVRTGRVGTDLAEAGQELSDARIHTVEARVALAESRRRREEALRDLERNTGAAVVVVGGGTIGCGAGTLAGAIGGAPLGPGGIILGGLRGGSNVYSRRVGY
jgi:hypothetical protein